MVKNKRFATAVRPLRVPPLSTKSAVPAAWSTTAALNVNDMIGKTVTKRNARSSRKSTRGFKLWPQRKEQKELRAPRLL